MKLGVEAKFIFAESEAKIINKPEQKRLVGLESGLVEEPIFSLKPQRAYHQHQGSNPVHLRQDCTITRIINNNQRKRASLEEEDSESPDINKKIKIVRE